MCVIKGKSGVESDERINPSMADKVFEIAKVLNLHSLNGGISM